MGGPVRQAQTRGMAHGLTVLIREKEGPGELQTLGPGSPFSTGSPTQSTPLGLGRSHRKSVEKGSFAARRELDFMTAAGAVASPGDPRQTCEPPAAFTAAPVPPWR